MSILNKYKRWVPMLVPINDEYWDFVLSQDNSLSISMGPFLSKDCLSAYINFGDKNCQYSGKYDIGVRSYPEYGWEYCVNEGAELEDIGFTGIDNGLIDYGGYSEVTNKEFYDIFTNSLVNIDSGDCRLYLHRVTGNTGVYSYDLDYIEDKYYELKGGFFQGFYKLFGFDYQVLPQYIENEWNVEIVLRPQDYEEAENTLNSTHPGNKGIFFYMGTRAEDKFLQVYNCDLTKYEDREQPSHEYCDGGYFSWDDLPDDFVDIAEAAGKVHREINVIKAFNLTYFLNVYGYNWNSSCSQGISRDIEGNEVPKSINCSRYLADEDYYEGDVIISGATVITSAGVPVEDSGYYEIKTDNKFLTFNRTKYGFTTATWDPDTVVVLTGSTNDIHHDNLFLLMNRTCSGYTTETIDQYYSEHKKPFNFTADTTGNAFALKYNDDGSISYRYLVKDCDADDKYSIYEETSFSGLVKEHEWNTINVKFSILNGVTDNCGKPVGQRKMKIFIYVNGYLKFISKEIPEFNFRELSTTAEKQEGVPFNISVGGGTQGLCDSVWLDYIKAFEKILPIEKNFAGTFIGDIKSFKFYTCKLPYMSIKNNHLYNIKIESNE